MLYMDYVGIIFPYSLLRTSKFHTYGSMFAIICKLWGLWGLKACLKVD